MAKKKGKKRRVLKGILGKLGAILVGAVPPVASGAEAIAHVSNPVREDMPMMDKIVLGMARFVNNITAGFSGKDAFESITLSGQASPEPVGNGWGGGTPFIATTLTGLGMVAADWLQSKLTKSATKIAGVTVTGKY
jgi:hypothetical protein